MDQARQATDYRDVHKKRKLSEVIPLPAPYLIQISCSDYCNFRCQFCFHSRGMEALKRDGFCPGTMTLETFRTLADQIKAFPEKVKAFRFTGFGEPLLNRDLPEMIRYAKQEEIAEKITIFTNASLLTPELNQQLIDSGLDEVMLSIEGLSDEKYLEITGQTVNVESMVATIQHLYEIRGNCRIYAKIIDVGMTDESQFHTLFDPISDLAFVEYASNAYGKVAFTEGLKGNYVGDALPERVEVCHLPFYYMYVNWNGDVTACHLDYSKSILFGNINDSSMVDIWNGSRMNEFRVMQLRKQRNAHTVCGQCNWVSVCACGVYENIIDDSADRLLKYFL